MQLDDLRLAVGHTKYSAGGWVEFARYADRSVAIVIREHATPHSEAQCKATVFIDHAPLRQHGQVWIKTWFENEGVFEALVQSSVIEPLERCYACSPHAIARLAKLTPAAMIELQRQEGGS